MARSKSNPRVLQEITAWGVTKTIIAYAEEHGIPCATVRTRLRNGWSPERALTTKVGADCKGSKKWDAELKATDPFLHEKNLRKSLKKTGCYGSELSAEIRKRLTRFYYANL